MSKIKFRPLSLALACLLAPYGQTHATSIPLDIIQEPNGGTTTIYRLGIQVGVNGATPKEYLFDTGSDSFNIDVGTSANGKGPAWFPNQPGVVPAAPQSYLYGDGTYGYWQSNINVSSMQFYNSASGAKVGSFDTPQGLPVAIALAWLTTTPNGPVITTGGDAAGSPLYADPNFQQKLNQGIAPEEGHFYGTFGAGDFVYAGDNGGPPGMLTKTGYIVEANGPVGVPGNCGQACLILDLTPALRAQFLTTVPWRTGRTGYSSNFTLSGANTARQFDALFNYTLDGGKTTAKLATLLDSGTTTIFVNDAGLLASATKNGQIDSANCNGTASNYCDAFGGSTLTVTGASTNAQPTSITTHTDTTGDATNVVTVGPNPYTSQGQTLYGVSFFIHNAVMYDLQNMATGYTPFYVTDSAITTSFTATAAMGPLGLAGVISGSGPFNIAAGGIANLSGSNTYTGLTNIAQGGWLGLAGPGSIATSAGVQVDGSFDISRAAGGVFIRTLSGTGSVQLGGNTLELTNASSVFNGQLTDGGLGGGSGGSVIVASGQQTLTGNNTYTGSTGVSPQAALLLNGSLAGSVVDAGLLGGQGHIGGNLAVSGVVAPGNGNGTYQTLTVAGNYSQASGAVYLAQANPAQAGVSSQIVVGGSATLAAGAIVNLAAGPAGQIYSKGARYTLLSASQGLSGSYSLTGATNLSATLGFNVAYDAQHVYLDVIQQRNLTDAANTRNETAALAGVQGLSPSTALFTTLSNLQTDGQIRNAANQLSGEVHASVQSTFLEDSHFVRDAVTARLRQASQEGAANSNGPASAAAVKTQANGLAWWGQFVGSWGHNNSDGNAASASRTLGGFVLGADMPVGESSRIGVAGGYTLTSFNLAQRNSSGSSDDAHLSVYAGTQLGGFGLRVGAAYTQHSLDTTRNINLPNLTDRALGDYKAHTAQVFGEAGYQFQFRSATIEPFAQAAYVKLNTDGFQERGGAAALTASGNSHARRTCEQQLCLQWRLGHRARHPGLASRVRCRRSGQCAAL